MIQQKSTKKRFYITDDYYYENLCFENLEEALQLIVEVQTEHPGNPIFQASKISKEELKSFYRPYFTSRCNPENSVHDIIYYIRGQASQYTIGYDIKKFVEEKRPIREVEVVENELFIRKLEIDRQIINITYPQMEHNGKMAMVFAGIHSLKCLPNQVNVAIKHMELILFFQGFSYWGGQTYNPRGLTVTLKNKRTSVYDCTDLIQKDPLNQKLISGFAQKPIFTCFQVSLNPNLLKKQDPELFEQYYKTFSLNLQLERLQFVDYKNLQEQQKEKENQKIEPKL